ncbi:MAG: endonuclease III domain-containing protein [Thermoplasmatota archaeon]
MTTLVHLYEILYETYGHQNWWPGETDFEMMVGAILTQNVNWKNVETAIQNLKREGLLNPRSIVDTEDKIIEEAIRPTGFYRQKSKRLKRLSSQVLEKGGVKRFLGQDDLRSTLLDIKGIGPETADSIVLYAAEEPSFVIDAYTKRILRRIDGVSGDHDELKTLFEKELPRDVRLYQDFHALFVELGKKHCKKDPECDGCPLKSICNYDDQDT